MQKKVLLTHSYLYRFDPKQWKSKRYYPPLGTLYAASVLREAGAQIIFHDSNLSNSAAELQPILQEHKPDILLIYDDGFNYLTKMCLTNMREAAFEMIKLGKTAGSIVIVCSSDSTDQYKLYLEKGVDYIVFGEGEITVKELYFKLNKGDFNVSEIQGIAYKENEKIVKTQVRLNINNLDNLPLPAWDLVDIEKYKRIWMKNHGFFSLNIASSRGCLYDCNWCAKPIYGRKYNIRSPENVADEIEFLISNYGVSHFWFCDDIFGLKKDWISEFRKFVEKENLSFNYTIQSRADLIIKSNVAEDLKATGAEMVWLGAESGSQKILNAMNKGQTVEEIYIARKVLAKNGVGAAFFIQFAYLGEKLEDIRKTIKMVLELMPDDIGISISYPLPGTIFHQQVKKDLITKSNWTDSDDLDLMYKGNFSVNYYRILHRFLHRSFRKKQRIKSLKKIAFRPSKWSSGKIRDLISVLYFIPALWIDKLKLKQNGGI